MPAAWGTTMTETKPKRRWFRFSIRDLLWLSCVTAVFSAWCSRRHLNGNGRYPGQWQRGIELDKLERTSGNNNVMRSTIRMRERQKLARLK